MRWDWERRPSFRSNPDAHRATLADGTSHRAPPLDRYAAAQNENFVLGVARVMRGRASRGEGPVEVCQAVL